jgi:23S rRNA A2030 N6-methylase RlmJ
VKVYLDENLSSDIARLLRAKGVDAVSAHEARKRQATDRAQLEFATAHDRVIATADVVDFVYLSRQAIAANSEHAGIIVVPPSFRGNEFQAIADAIHEIVRRYPDGLRGSVVYLQRAQ